MEIIEDLEYTQDHEWVMIDGDTVVVGISDFAQQQLGDIVFVELPEVGTFMEPGDTLGNIESVKAVAELYCPITGEVIEVNKELEETPELVNEQPFDDGWIVKLRVDPADVGEADLLNAEEYRKLVEKS